MKISIVITDVVNDVTYSRKSVNTRVVITLLLHDVIHWKQRRHIYRLLNEYRKIFGTSSYGEDARSCEFNDTCLVQRRHTYTYIVIKI